MLHQKAKYKIINIDICERKTTNPPQIKSNFNKTYGKIKGVISNNLTFKNQKQDRINHSRKKRINQILNNNYTNYNFNITNYTSFENINISINSLSNKKKEDNIDIFTKTTPNQKKVTGKIGINKKLLKTPGILNIQIKDNSNKISNLMTSSSQNVLKTHFGHSHRISITEPNSNNDEKYGQNNTENYFLEKLKHSKSKSNKKYFCIYIDEGEDTKKNIIKSKYKSFYSVKNIRKLSKDKNIENRCNIYETASKKKSGQENFKSNIKDDYLIFKMNKKNTCSKTNLNKKYDIRDILLKSNDIQYSTYKKVNGKIAKIKKIERGESKSKEEINNKKNIYNGPEMCFFSFVENIQKSKRIIFEYKG